MSFPLCNRKRIFCQFFSFCFIMSVQVITAPDEHYHKHIGYHESSVFLVHLSDMRWIPKRLEDYTVLLFRRKKTQIRKNVQRSIKQYALAVLKKILPSFTVHILFMLWHFAWLPLCCSAKVGILAKKIHMFCPFPVIPTRHI